MIKCTINNIEYRLHDNVSIKEHLGNKTNTSLTIRVDDQEIPQAGDIIRVFDQDTNTILFIGVCGIPQSPTYKALTDLQDYKISCRNINNILADRLVNYAEEGQTLTQVITDLFNQYIATEGITLGTIGNFDDTILETYVVPDTPLDEVLTELAGFDDAAWNVDKDRTFSFLKQNEFNVFSQEINANFVPFQKFKHKTKDIDTRTVQIITGATERTSEQTSRNFTYDGSNNTFIVDFPLVQKPRVFVNTVEIDSSRVGVNGLDSGNNDIYFLFSNRSTDIIYNTDSNFLNTNDVVYFMYFGEFETRIRVSNDSAIAEVSSETGFSGIKENIVTNSTLTNSEDTIALAQSLLDHFGVERGEITCSITDAHLRKLGYSINDFDIKTQLNFNLPEIGIVGAFVITERTIKFQSTLDAINNLEVQLKLLDRNFLRSYAEDISNIDQSIRRLNIRADEVIIQNQDATETMTMSEILTFNIDNVYYPVANVSSNQLFDPAPFEGTLEGVYPI